MSRVLITGVSRDTGARIARGLVADHRQDTVIGVDVVPPRQDLGPVRFVRADIRNPGLSKVLDAEGIDTVVHAGVVATPRAAGGRASMKEINVIGTMQLLAACQRSPQVSRLVVKSSTSVYGAGPRDPAMFTEQLAARSVPGGGLARDIADIEGYVRGFAARRPDVAVTVLRMANWIGPRTDSPLMRYLQLPVVPTVLGFDARLQFLQADDGVAAIAYAACAPTAGTYNIAGDGIMVMSQVLRRLGRPMLRLPGPAAVPAAGLVRRLGLADFSPDQLSFLTYGRGVDTTAMRRELGFTPRYTTEEAFETLRTALRPGITSAAIRLVGGVR